MKKALVILLVLLVAVAADAAVKKKRFDVGTVSDTVTTTVETPVGSSQ